MKCYFDKDEVSFFQVVLSDAHEKATDRSERRQVDRFINKLSGNRVYYDLSSWDLKLLNDSVLFALDELTKQDTKDFKESELESREKLARVLVSVVKKIASYHGVTVDDMVDLKKHKVQITESL